MSGRHASLSRSAVAVALMISVFSAHAAHAQTGTESAPPSTSGPTMGPMNKDQLEMGESKMLNGSAI